MPNDHVRMLVEHLQPIGPDLARRWLAALAMVARDEREAMVATVERRIAELYASPDQDAHAPPPPAVIETKPNGKRRAERKKPE